MSKTQKAYVYREYGNSSSVLELTDLPQPTAGADEVLIRVSYTGINPVDWKLRCGYIKAWPQSLPIVPGWDAVGTVEAVGEQAASSFKKGETVFTYTRPAFDLPQHPECKAEAIGLFDGTSQQYISVKAWKVAHVPKKASLAEAAGVPLAGLTAYQALHDEGGLQKGQTVLIPGGSGGVGSFAVGIAKAAGAHVIASCSAKNVDYVKKLGADEVLDYGKGTLPEQLKGRNIDLVFDCVGGETTTQGIQALKEGGVIVSIASFDVGETAKKQGRVGKAFLVRPSGDQLRILGGLIDDGKVQLPAVEELAWAKLKEAHDRSQSGRTVGKLVVKVD